MKASARRAIVYVAILVFIPLYAFFGVSIGSAFAEKPWWQGMIFFAVAGVLWVIPFYPMFKWMRAAPDYAAQVTEQAFGPKRR